MPRDTLRNTCAFGSVTEAGAGESEASSQNRPFTRPYSFANTNSRSQRVVRLVNKGKAALTRVRHPWGVSPVGRQACQHVRETPHLRVRTVRCSIW